MARAEQAVQLMEEGKLDESIAMLKEAQQIDPEGFIYPYEIAYAHYLKKDYAKTIEVLNGLHDHKDLMPLLYQLLGNAYDVSGDPEKALVTYDQGLRKFPNAGMLHLEKGTVLSMQERYDEAIASYEEGIRVDPTFPSNYYHAARMFCGSSEPLWGVIYGELFMLLEPGTDRTQAVGKMLHDTYARAITWSGDTGKVDFTTRSTMTLEDLQAPDGPRIPLGIQFATTMAVAITGENKIDALSLDRIRTRYLKMFYESGQDKKYGNVLFDYQKQLLDKGHFQAYNLWLFSAADTKITNAWYNDNTEQFKSFYAWFEEHPIALNSSNLFLRSKY